VNNVLNPSILASSMKISIIVPAYNEEKLLPQTLASIRSASRGFTTLGWEVQWIVCDNNSSDRTAELAREHGACVVFEPVNQIARARNAGAAAADGDWLVFVDADSSPTQGLFESVAQQIESGRVIGGGSTVRLDRHAFGSRFWLGCWNLLSRLRRWAAGSFIFCEAKAFREIGGFDQKFYASEEVDFSNRLKRVGKSRGLGFVILTEHPLLTSARKLDLYRSSEVIRFLFRALRQPRATVQDPKACYIWYDGRR